MIKLAIKQLWDAAGRFWAWARVHPWPFFFLAAFLWVLIRTIRVDNMGFQSKSFWDWMDLMLVPAALAYGVWWLRKRQEEVQREIATDKRQQDALQYYLDRVTELLPERRTENAQGNIRWQTLVALRAIDGRRKGQVLCFLYEHDLIIGDDPVVSLRHAELKNADLIVGHPHHWDDRGEWIHETLFDYVAYAKGNERWKANLQGVNLEDADLHNAVFVLTDLQGAHLQNAHLRQARLIGADLRGADLQGADLRDAILCGADFTGAKATTDQLLSARTLEKATMPDGTKYEEWIKRQDTAGSDDDD